MCPDLLDKGYEPHDVERRWYAFWEENDLFAAEDQGPRRSYSIVIPPPNVTGVLHMGHALNNTLQDILCRYRRMCGDNVLWMPGTDHAGIATQNVVERKLAQEGTDRHELGRERFIDRVWKWREKYGSAIINQLKRLGASCDWERERFTMDEGLSRAVRKVFVDLYDEGLIYRGDYIINWCPRCHTALSDLEVEHEEIEGNLYHIRYPFADGERRHHRRHHPARDHARRHRRGREPGGRALPRPRGGRGDPAAHGPGDPDHPRRLRRHELRHRRPEGHPGPRPQRLRDRPAPRPAERQGHRRRRADDGGGRPLSRAWTASPAARRSWTT